MIGGDGRRAGPALSDTCGARGAACCLWRGAADIRTTRRCRDSGPAWRYEGCDSCCTCPVRRVLRASDGCTRSSGPTGGAVYLHSSGQWRLAPSSHGCCAPAPGVCKNSCGPSIQLSVYVLPLSRTHSDSYLPSLYNLVQSN